MDDTTGTDSQACDNGAALAPRATWRACDLTYKTAAEFYLVLTERDGELTKTITPHLRPGGLSAPVGKLMIERGAVRVKLLDLLEAHPALAKLGKPDWVDELSHEQ